MCGFAGWWDVTASATREETDLRLGRMLEALALRGPDDEGRWLDLEAGVALGFRRLSIIDLSPTGHQPMVSASGRHVLTLNGEIYNFMDLRRDLEGHGVTFRGHSDTEVLLEAIEHWGLEATLERLNGMFAIAVWNRQENSLSLARDRFGKKPLLYGWAGHHLLFGSTLHGLRRHPAFRAPVDRDALAAYLHFAYVPGPQCIFSGFRKLRPGSVMTLRQPTPGVLPEPVSFWDARLAAENASSRSSGMPSFEACADRLEELLLDAVRVRCIADVPLGAFLSGGIDSSLVVALMQRLGGPPARTFSIGFDDKPFDEAPYARAVARHLGTDHTELYVTPQQALDVVPLLPDIYDEPFADSSQIPTYLVSRLARTAVTVALSGDGGDELFGGYERYGVAQRLLARFGWLPAPVRHLGGWACGAAPARPWDATVGAILGPRFGSTRLRKLGRVLGHDRFADTYREMMAYWSQPEDLVPGARRIPTLFDTACSDSASMEPIHRMMFVDIQTYLVDDILVKVDRASMASSLEARNPFLDVRVHDFAWSLPLSFKWSEGVGKRILKQILHRHVPPALVDRPKMGFGIPLRDWLRGPLRDWADELLSPAALESSGLEPARILAAWAALKAGTGRMENPLWPVLVFQQWLRSDPDERGLR